MDLAAMTPTKNVSAIEPRIHAMRRFALRVAAERALQCGSAAVI